jgi:hypothetical protein
MTRWRSETKVRDRLVRRIESVGGACELHVCPGSRGDPDTLCSFPWGYHCLVETKWASNEKPEPHQRRRHQMWRGKGLDVWMCCDDGDIEAIIDIALRAKKASGVGDAVSD